MKISDIMIHINETLNEEARRTLEHSLRKLDWVIAPRFNAGRNHLLMVTYDLDKTTTARLLARTRDAGYTAQLVGM